MDSFEWIRTGAMCAAIAGILLNVVPIMLWVERRGSALMQNRLGPNRVGPLGLFQAIADALKFVFKEDPIPGHVEKFYYVLAPLISLIPSFMTFAVIPFAAPIALDGRTVHFQVADLNVGFLYIFAIASLGVYGIIMGGWASNNKYALLGSLRSSSQMISYELSLGLSVIPMVMIYQTMSLGDIAAFQAQPLFFIGSVPIPSWGIFLFPVGPISFLILLTAVFAETNRLPFDLPEGESEIVAGYHVEYGALKFALLMMAEYLNMTTASGLLTALYFGGYHFPGLHLFLNAIGLGDNVWALVALQAGVFWGKVAFFMWFFVWVRWTLPRFRFDQVMDLGWKVMLPLCLVNIFVTGVLIYYKVF